MSEKDLENGIGESALPLETPERRKERDSIRDDSSLTTGRASHDNVQHETGNSSAHTGVGSPAPQQDPIQDPFEVEWDGGDNDPLCPRSMKLARKWLIVFITCFGSLCV